MPDPRSEYGRRIGEIDRRLASGERRHLLISNLRLVLFAAAAVTAWLAFERGVISPVALFVPAGLFGLLLIVHAQVLNANERTMRAKRYYKRGLSRLAGTWADQGPDGAAFLEHHPYARDLDLFGPGSLFQLLTTARTQAGEETLAGWLGRFAAKDESIGRQQAVAELRDMIDFRETIAVAAADAHVSRTGALSRWGAAEPVGLTLGHTALFGTCAVLNGLAVAALFAGWLSLPVTVSWLLVTAAVARYHRRAVWRVIRGIDAAADDLSLFRALLAKLESATFKTGRLEQLRRALEGDAPASSLIARLQRAISARDALRNEFVRPFGLLLFVRSLAAVEIDRWHQRRRSQLLAWIDAVGEFEAVASLATYAFEHPADPFPSVAGDAPLFHAVGLAHPLLQETVAVRNDVRIGGDAPHLLVVSGSNMSGKSTLLRAVGINTALAMAGGPVRAQSLTLKPMRIGASIRVDDSLQEGHSRFYSEILRIRHIVELAMSEPPVLFLLDEILHGTNSHDRRIGAEAIVRTLVDAAAVGLITTHDLALTAVADMPEMHARNVHFEDRVEAGRMVFDYRMREGVVERSNALELMRAVGLKV